MSLQWYVYPLALMAGIAAGIINTLAGSGSLLTLPLLLFLGLPPNVANGTNRVGVVMQNVVSVTTLYRAGRLQLTGALWLVVVATAGSIVGALIAVDLNKQAMNIAIGIMMVVMLLVILFDPQRWLRPKSELKSDRHGIGALALFFIIGVYAGFIQAGVGIFILAAMVMGLGYSLVEANCIKLLLILVTTAVALLIFAGNSQVEWGIGGLMAVGQGTGAWLAARFALSRKDAAVWVRRLLIAVVILSILKQFGLLPL